jgi:hypothetical protein
MIILDEDIIVIKLAKELFEKYKNESIPIITKMALLDISVGCSKAIISVLEEEIK